MLCGGCGSLRRMSIPRETEEGFEEMERYVLYVRPLCEARGMKKAYHLWLKLGGSKGAAADLWAGRTTGVNFDQLSRLCHILRCKPGRLFAAESEIETE